VNLYQALASFEDIYSPRIVARMNDYDVRIAHARGEHVWHVHDDTDEFFLVLEGTFDIAMRDAEGRETEVTLGIGDTFVVPAGTEHKPSSPKLRAIRQGIGNDLGTVPRVARKQDPPATAFDARRAGERCGFHGLRSGERDDWNGRQLEHGQPR
jgi:mannose-6-phosphate isomerase-like protein (cupin superfamily)